MQPFFSIVVPVYNMEKYILMALDSVKNQIYHSFEVIVVDDGSSDKTFELCQDYAKSDERFHIYHQNNGGPMLARKTALSYAKGQYCLFLDSDDCFENCLLKTVYDFIQKNKCDIVIFNSTSFFKNKTIKHDSVSDKEEIWTSDRALIELLKNTAMYSLCAKAIKKTVIDSAGQEFYRPINHLEDFLQSAYYLANSEKIGVMSNYLYNCRRRKESLSSEKMTLKIIREMVELKIWTENYVISKTSITEQELLECQAHVLCDFMGDIYLLNKNKVSKKQKVEILQQVYEQGIPKKFLNIRHIARVANRNKIRAMLFKHRLFRTLISVDRILLLIQKTIFKFKRMEWFEK